ncbi:MAG: gfo/Idh/MocA family oxidoreductase, partial [Verrucomicrobiota bacterium]|nr:gfo/Idh/MocA family oxidoreductase [Verrucomicrobiota bacterium]
MRQTRRMFLKQSGLAMMAVGAVPGILRGATDKIRVGFIGVGNRGSQLLQSFMKNDDCEVAAL